MELFKSRKFYNCDCGTEGIIVDHDDEDKQFYFVIWEYGQKGSQLGWWDRLRHCWKMLKSGFPYEDQTILCTEEAERLANDLLIKTKEWKNKKSAKANEEG